MAKVSLILADSDEFFSDKFSRYILEHNNFFDIITFTQIDYLKEYLKNNTADIILLGKSFAEPEILNYSNAPILILDDVSGDVQEHYHINKYQKTDNIIKEITFKYAESVGDKSILSSDLSKAKTIAVYSAAGGSGKTSVALALSGCLVQLGFKTLYLSLEKFNSNFCLVGENPEGLSEIFLKIKNKNPNLSFEIIKKMNTDSSGVNFLNPPESAMEFNEMTGDEIVSLIEEAADISELDFLILDLPSEFNKDIMDVLKLSNNIVFVTACDVVGKYKTQLYMKEMNIFPDLQIVYDKVMPLVNKSESGGVPQDIAEIFGEKAVVGSIPVLSRMKQCKSVSDITGLLDNYVMGAVRQLAEK